MATMGNTDRAVNITASCSVCGETLDTNHASLGDVVDGDGILDSYELHVGTSHECWGLEEIEIIVEDDNA
jgi:hypothetical protein